ncbi:nitroreductase [Saccharopolyspora sp. NFXS83]|uniref:nitroreductase n=1 Tax=Saccharopolyspora sp. NFXS83 TaxID=2993560 RepID=UPI00224B5200|nr:nitroreductase [Saccharopolyspora sp. NFXS83]MCX2730654.1 nitroreductase [Saccharopolyspora sp. NFXS83]
MLSDSQTLPHPASSISDVIRTRRSPREFLPDPVPVEVIRGVLEDAQSAPSHSNTQPWLVHVASGATRDELSAELLAAHDEERRTPDFTDTYGDGVHLARSQHHGAALYGVLGIARSDHERRNEVVRDNLRFYGAPHVAFLFVPRLGDGVRAASDVGMYAQNFLLSLHGRGFQGIPQAVHGLYADTAREVLGVPDELKLLFGIAFGTAAPESPVRSLEIGRVPLEESVVLHDTPVW